MPRVSNFQLSAITEDRTCNICVSIDIGMRIDLKKIKDSLLDVKA